jgi:peptidoglycan-associated lipoprotein
MRLRSGLALVLASLLVASLFGASGCARKSVQSPPSVPSPPTSQSPRETPAPSQLAPSPSTPAVVAGDFVPVFFGYDSNALDATARTALDRNAKLLRDKPDLRITIEGHCDERGTVEYNLSLGERRAQTARDYLVAAGVAAARIETISYGKERPFDDGHSESAWARNRRAHFVVR